MTSGRVPKEEREVPFGLEHLEVVMEPEPGKRWETEGVLNPGTARGPDGELCLFPQLVVCGNYSRIGSSTRSSMTRTMRLEWRGSVSR